jgi:hypothetical protein
MITLWNLLYIILYIHNRTQESDLLDVVSYGFNTLNLYQILLEYDITPYSRYSNICLNLYCGVTRGKLYHYIVIVMELMCLKLLQDYPITMFVAKCLLSF